MAETNYDASTFTASPRPKWNVPTKWFTEVGMELMRKTFYSVFRDVLASEGEDFTIRKPQIVTDAIQRDVDTSFALYQGIRDFTLANNENLDMTLELPDLSYDPSLFKPLNGVNPLCKKEYSTDRLLNDTIKRLRLVPPPETNLNQTLLPLEQLGGIGLLAHLHTQPKFFFRAQTNIKIKINSRGNKHCQTFCSNDVLFSCRKGPPNVYDKCYFERCVSIC
jgi:hypothetical protein